MSEYKKVVDSAAEALIQGDAQKSNELMALAVCILNGQTNWI